jgi:hypothetical protein
MLQITPAALSDPQSPGNLLASGRLTIQTSDPLSTSVTLRPEQTNEIPIWLGQGQQDIRLSLQDEATGRPLRMVVRAISLQPPDAMPLPGDILVNGQPQHNTGNRVIALYQSGWYAPDTSYHTGWYETDQAAQWRWASSPAELLVYSPVAQQAYLTMLPRLLHQPDSDTGLGEQGTLRLALNGAALPPHTIRVHQPLQIETRLQAGWNRLVFALEAGNFRPVDMRPENIDQRLLSFALAEINITTTR